jgi:hypothetical protein
MAAGALCCALAMVTGCTTESNPARADAAALLGGDAGPPPTDAGPPREDAESAALDATPPQQTDAGPPPVDAAPLPPADGGLPSPTCTNECTVNAVECAGPTSFRRCGDLDADACLEWGPVTACPEGERCSNGRCADVCENECRAEGDRRCTSSGVAYRVCRAHADGCLGWALPVACPAGESCTDGACGTTCACDFYRGVCEPAAPGASAPCACDPDCAGGAAPCTADGHCDSWCPPETDPDCACDCQFNEYCEAAAPGSVATCACDRDCEPHDVACMDDGHCDVFCPDGVDPDCGADACRERWMSIGWRWASELALGGAWESPDPAQGDPAWVLFSPDGWAGGGTGEIFVEFAAEHRACVRWLDLAAYGYDDSVLGDGAEMYLWNWTTGRYDLLPATLDRAEGVYENAVADPAPYLLCGSGPRAKCFAGAKLAASTWDNSHVRWVELAVYLQP